VTRLRCLLDALAFLGDAQADGRVEVLVPALAAFDIDVAYKRAHTTKNSARVILGKAKVPPGTPAKGRIYVPQAGWAIPDFDLCLDEQGNIKPVAREVAISQIIERLQKHVAGALGLPMAMIGMPFSGLVEANAQQEVDVGIEIARIMRNALPHTASHEQLDAIMHVRVPGVVRVEPGAALYSDCL